MKRKLLVLALLSGVSLSCRPAHAGAAAAKAEKTQVSYLLSKVRVLPKAGAAAVLAGARITGSNDSATFGFVTLARIDKAPADGQWLEIPVSTRTVCRWVKIEAAPDTLLAVAEIEFHSATGKLSGQPFGTVTPSAEHAAKNAFDGDPATAFEAPITNAYVGLCLSGMPQAAAPTFDPGGGAFARPLKVGFNLWPPNPAEKIRYTTDGSNPSRTHGELFSRPFLLTRNTSVAAIAFEDGKADSRIEVVSYLIGADQKLGAEIKSYHLGNSLTDTTRGMLDIVALSGGKNLTTYCKTIPGCDIGYHWTSSGGGFGYPESWSAGRPLVGHPQGWATRYEEVLAAKVDHLFLQPFPNPGGLRRDTKYGGNFIQLARQHNPDVQVWLYAQWACYPAVNQAGKVVAAYCEQQGGRSWEKDEPEVWLPPIPHDEVKTWDDALVNHMHYYRTILKRWNAIPGGKKPVRLCPGGPALVRLEKAIAAGKLPGVEDFGRFTFSDAIHLSRAGAYLVTLVHYACMFGESPEGKVTWATSGVSQEQARVLQRIAWETVVNEPDSGVKAVGK